MSAEKQVALSYAWEDEAYRKRVGRLRTYLMSRGIQVTSDATLKAGQSLSVFMERLVQPGTHDHVLVLMSPKYKSRADQVLGGVGTEAQYLRREVMADAFQQRIVPVLFAGDGSQESRATCTPTFLEDRLALSCFDDDSWDSNVRDIANHALGIDEVGPEGAVTAAAPSTWSAALVKATAVVFEAFEGGESHPGTALLRRRCAFVMLDQHEAFRTAVKRLQEAGWLTVTVMGRANTPGGSGRHVTLQGTPAFSEILDDDEFLTALRALQPERAFLHTEVERPEKATIQESFRLERSTPKEVDMVGAHVVDGASKTPRLPVPGGFGEDQAEVLSLLSTGDVPGVHDVLDGVLRDGQRRRARVLFEALLATPGGAEALRRWVLETPGVAGHLGLMRLLIHSAADALTVARAAERHALVQTLLKSLLESGAVDNARWGFEQLLAGIRTFEIWEDGGWNLVHAGLMTFWSVTSVETADARDEVVTSVLRAARLDADAGRTEAVCGAWTALAYTLHSTGNGMLLWHLNGPLGVQQKGVLASLNDDTATELLNALDHARGGPLEHNEDRAMRNGVVDMVAGDVLAAIQGQVDDDQFEWLVRRAGMFLGEARNVEPRRR